MNHLINLQIMLIEKEAIAAIQPFSYFHNLFDIRHVNYKCLIEKYKICIKFFQVKKAAVIVQLLR